MHTVSILYTQSAQYLLNSVNRLCIFFLNSYLPFQHRPTWVVILHIVWYVCDVIVVPWWHLIGDILSDICTKFHPPGSIFWSWTLSLQTFPAIFWKHVFTSSIRFYWAAFFGFSSEWSTLSHTVPRLYTLYNGQASFLNTVSAFKKRALNVHRRLRFMKTIF